MIEWLKSQWKKIAAGVALFIVGAVVYFSGRFNSKGELDFAAAKRELELNTARGASLERKVQENHEQRVEIVADILSEEIALARQKESNHALSPDEVLARLRAHGLVKP